MRENEIDPRDPRLIKELDNKCGYCGNPCERDFCNKDCFQARDN